MSRKNLPAILLVVLFAFSFFTVMPALAQGNRVCEQCGMVVSPEAQARYVVTDGTGNIHYVECFMCALRLVGAYSQLEIRTSCDWYGPNYSVTVDSTNFGREITVNPPTAIFLNGGSCVVNRVAYNQTASDALLENGFSQFTLSNQHYALPTNTVVKRVQEAAFEYAQSSTTGSPDTSPTTVVLIVVAVVGFAVIFGSVVALKKLCLHGTKKSRGR